MQVVTSIRELIGAGVGESLSAAPLFVPTMGALHAGHLALVRHAVDLRAELHQPSSTAAAPPIVVSIFVNPTQFNDRADLARYPRTLEADAAACRQAGADIVFAPATDEVYPPDAPVPVPPLPPVATQPGLEDALRPGHFAGVCQVVSRLFDLVHPAVAVFGEKDWQQLQVIKAMVEESSRNSGKQVRPRIVGMPTVREPDGLAMSSRNVFLKPAERITAAAISQALRAAAEVTTASQAETVMRDMLTWAGLEVQYAVVRNASTLLAPRPGLPCRALIAVRLGAVRLIDNAPWPRP